MSKKSFDLSVEDRRRLYSAVSGAANFIETGDPVISARDAEAMRDHEHERRYPGRTSGSRARALTTEQMREVVALRDLANRFLG